MSPRSRWARWQEHIVQSLHCLIVGCCGICQLPGQTDMIVLIAFQRQCSGHIADTCQTKNGASSDDRKSNAPRQTRCPLCQMAIMKKVQVHRPIGKSPCTKQSTCEGTRVSVLVNNPDPCDTRSGAGEYLKESAWLSNADLYRHGRPAGILCTWSPELLIPLV